MEPVEPGFSGGAESGGGRLEHGVPNATSADVSWERERTALRVAEASVARISRLQAATAALSASRTPGEVADAALGAGIAALDGSCGLVLVDDGGELTVLRCANVSEAEARTAATATGPNPVADAFRTGAPVFVQDHEELVARYPAAVASRVRVGAIATLPLALEGRTIGVLSVGFEGPRHFCDADRALAYGLAAQCAHALDRARLFVSERLARTEAVAARARLAFLDELSAHLAESESEGEMLEGVARLAVPALGDWVGLFVTTERGEIALAAQAGPAALGAAVEAHLRSDPLLRLARACECGPAVGVHDFPGEAGTRAVASAAIAPLCLRGRALGAIVVAAADPLRRYAPPDLALAADVGHRTALAVEHARLLREATAAARAREEFLHVASHELRGPIGTLRLAVQLLGRDVRKARTEEVLAHRLRIIDRQAGRLARLSDMLLDVSRITAGRLELARDEGDLSALVREIVARVGDEAAQANVEIRVDAPEKARCTFDAARMDQVVSNLLSNAVKYGRDAPVDVRLRVVAGRAVLEVEDRGIGIAPADQERIFGRFERAVPAQHFAGLGLGLWIVRQLVEAHGGAIRVRSVQGKGTTFTVELPA